MSLVAERTGITGQRGRRARLLRRSLAAFAVGGAAVGLFACYLRVSATFAAGSDGASNALEAWDLLHGNWPLHGWTLAPRRWYTLAAIWVLLTATIVADKIAIVDTAVPLAFAGGLHAIWGRATPHRSISPHNGCD